MAESALVERAAEASPTVAPAPVVVRIPGEPCVQGRGRAFILKGRNGAPDAARVHDDPKSRNWKATAQQHMQRAMLAAGHYEAWKDEPLEVVITDVFALPRSARKKTKRVPRRWHTKARGDADNLAKAVLDAGNSVLWLDDCLVARLVVEKIIGAQGEAPYVLVEVRSLQPHGAVVERAPQGGPSPAAESVGPLSVAGQLGMEGL
jgi:Holliday junction resolvase RusA-like endonuclease